MIGHEGPAVELKYSSTLSLTSALDGGGLSTPCPQPLYPQERPGIGGWEGPRAGLVRKISLPTGIPSLG